MDRFRSFVMAILVIAISACGHSPTAPNPTPTTTPTPTPTPTPGNAVTLRLTDTLTGSPVVGPTMTAMGLAVQVNSEGKATFNGLSIGQVVSVSVPDGTGHRSRRTLYCGVADIDLQPNDPNGVDEPILHGVGYSWPQFAAFGDQIWYSTSIGWMPSDEIKANPQAMANMERAAVAITSKSRGKIQVKVGTPGAWTYPWSIDPNALAGAVTAPGPGPSAFVAFRNMDNVTQYAVVLREGWRTTGMTGTSPYPGIFGPFATGTEITSREEGTMLVRLSRAIGALFAGDDDSMIPCGARNQ